jgi:hypothetical protein
MKNLSRNNANKVEKLVFELAQEQGFDLVESKNISDYIWLVLTGHELQKDLATQMLQDLANHPINNEVK